MLVICEDCAKKYNIDEALIKGEKARFSCQECGHIIVVTKPVASETSAEDEQATSEKREMTDEEAMALLAEMDSPEPDSSTVRAARTTSPKKTTAPRKKGTPIGVSIFFTLFIGFLTISAMFAYLAFLYVPNIINHQIELRTKAVSQSFSGVINKPLLLRNYLQVNKEARRTSQLPGVAYAAVVNKKGVVIAGFFSDLQRFDSQFAQQIKQKGFPAEILAQNKPQPGVNMQNAKLVIGGQRIYDEAVAVADTGAEVHVGVFISEVDDAIRQAIKSPVTLAIIGGVLLVGLIVFIMLTRSITRPMRALTDVANRISLGEMDLVIKTQGPREIRELATAFDRMRHSIKAAMDRLRK